MTKNKTPSISKSDLKLLNETIWFMKVAELRKCCAMLGIPDTGQKGKMVDRIISYAKTGVVKKNKIIPDISKSKGKPKQLLKPTSLMLHSEYKNDLKTRIFFKSLIGSHFHFTAFGIDWLNERWQDGNPPTYKEFADYWINETEKRKLKKPKPKKEWAYINFLQNYKKENPGSSKDDSIRDWKKLRLEKATMAIKIIKNIVQQKSCINIKLN